MAKARKKVPVKRAKVRVKTAPKKSVPARKIKPSVRAAVKKAAPAEISKSKKAVKSNGSKPVKAAPPKPLTAELRQIRSRLLTMLTDVRKDIVHEVKGAAERDLAHINDTSDMASDAAEGDLSLRIAESETAEASEIERAIEKIDTGTYGICEVCNKPIGTDRIQFLPYVTLCIKCQALAEIRKREQGDELDDLSSEGGESDDN